MLSLPPCAMGRLKAWLPCSTQMSWSGSMRPGHVQVRREKSVARNWA
jgi:hypothetical protein